MTNTPDNTCTDSGSTQNKISTSSSTTTLFARPHPPRDRVEPAPTTQCVLFVGALSSLHDMDRGWKFEKTIARRVRRETTRSLWEEAMRTFSQFQKDLDAIRKPYESELVRAIPFSCVPYAALRWMRHDDTNPENMQSMQWDLSDLLNILETHGEKQQVIDVENIGILGFKDYDTFVSAIAEWQKAWEAAIDVTQKCVTTNDGKMKFAVLMFKKK